MANSGLTVRQRFTSKDLVIIFELRMGPGSEAGGSHGKRWWIGIGAERIALNVESCMTHVFVRVRVRVDVRVSECVVACYSCISLF